jgi:hypothetical protein
MPTQLVKLYINSLPMPDSGPLSVYSPERWVYLQDKGHVWEPSINRARRMDNSSTSGYILGVPVPGDPAYSPEKVESQGALS